MNIPTTLRHKPIVVSETYEQIDGRFPGNTDAISQGSPCRGMP